MDALLEQAVVGGAGATAGRRRSRRLTVDEPAPTPTRRTTSVAARASGSGSRVGRTPASTARAIASFTGTRASTGRSSTSPISLAPKRPARLVEQHDTGGVLERGRVDGPPQREVAAAQHHDRDVGHLDHRARGRLARGAAVDEDRRRPAPERHRERGAALGCRQQGGRRVGPDRGAAGRRRGRPRSAGDRARRWAPRRRHRASRRGRRRDRRRDRTRPGGHRRGRRRAHRRRGRPRAPDGRARARTRRRTRTCRIRPWGTRGR